MGCGTGEDDTNDSETTGDDGSDSTGDAGDTDITTDTDETSTDTGESEEDSGGGLTCTPLMNDLGLIEIPNPLISRDANIAVSEGVSDADQLVDGLFHNKSGASFGSPTEDAPEWVSVEVGVGYTHLLVLWADAGWTDYDDPSGGAPLAYTIQYSEDSTDGVDGTWQDAVAVTDNPVRTRAHNIAVTEETGWIRLLVTSGQEKASTSDTDTTPQYANVKLDELSVYDTSATGEAMPEDTWFFMGDSITKMAIEKVPTASRFDPVVADSVDGFFPAVIPGGIGGEFAYDAIHHIDVDKWLELNPDFKHITLAYGTNDAWNKSSTTKFEEDLRTLIETLLDAGRVPHIPSIPYSPASSHTNLPKFNAVIDSLIKEYELPCGPDLYTWFKQHQEELGTDNIHPDSVGLASVNRLWAESSVPLYVVK
jgi:lysophospholipase L1-like esterase